MKTSVITFACFLLAAYVTGQTLLGNQELKPLQHRNDHVTQYFRADAFNNLMNWQLRYYHVPGLQVGIMHDGELTWKNHYGWAYYEPPVPVTDSTLFVIASISKTITGTAIFKSIENGKMELHGDISNHLPFPIKNPWYPEIPITPAMLMTHSSTIVGIGPMWQPPYAYNFACSTPVSLDTFMHDFYDTAGIHYSAGSFINYPPGAYGEYADAGMTVGGYVVESAWNRLFYQFCNDSIFGPLEMNRSRFMIHEIDTMQLAMGYAPEPGIPKPKYHSVWSSYPPANLRSNVTELSHFLSMFINHGMYKNKKILDSADVELINTVHDTINVQGSYPHYWGYSWEHIIDFDSWGHGGNMADESRGVITYCKSGRWGGIYLMNTSVTANDVVYRLLEAGPIYRPITITTLKLSDPDNNGICESGETIQFYTSLTNNLMVPVTGVTGIIESDDPNVEISTSSYSFGNIDPAASSDNQVSKFQFLVKGEFQPHEAVFRMIIHYDQKDDTLLFPVYLGRAEILLLKDNLEFSGPENYYLDALAPLGFQVQFRDAGIQGIPDSIELRNYRSVIWFTGYDYGESQLTNALPALSDYLDHGGNLFLTGQNICDRAENADFLHNYMHAVLVDTITFATNIFGNQNDTIGKGLLINISGGMKNQYSPGRIDTVNGSKSIFHFPGNPHSGGVHFEGEYKTVFLSFGFEGISEKEDRDTLMARIFRNFGVFAGAGEKQQTISRLKLSIVPNPVIGKATIKYFIPASGMANITVFDNWGKVIQKLVGEIKSAGDHQTTLSTTGLAPGIYYCTLKCGDEVLTEKVIVKR